MKKNDWAIVIATAAYSFLFYHQNAGINFLLFSVLLTGLLAWLYKDAVKNWLWLLTAGLSLLSGIFVFIHGSSLSILANLVSLLLLSALSVNHRSSVIFNLFNSLYALLGSPVFLVKDIIHFSSQGEQREKNGMGIKLLIYLIPLLLGFVFLFIYKQANPLFDKYTEQINLDFVSAGWIFFTLGGFLLMYGYIKHTRVAELDEWEKNNSGTIPDNGTLINLNERTIVFLLFGLLNLMLLFINLLDVNYLYLGEGLPKGITHKQFVHKGVGMLILSILLGISIILYFFRGGLNFDEKSKKIKWLVYLWLLQNLFMILSTALRNHMYIHEALLTYKRIGVCYWLLLAALGIITTFIKLYKIRTHWYLFRVNSFLACLILVASAGIDWDRFIGDYNMKHVKYLASLDKRYLISISETNLGQLYLLKSNEKFNTDSVYHYESAKPYLNSAALDRKLYDYLKSFRYSDWRSYNLRDERVLSELKTLDARGILDSLDLSDTYVRTVEPLYFIQNLKDLTLGFVHIETNLIYELKQLKRLETLDIHSLSKRDLLYLKQLTHLKTLYTTAQNKESLESLRKQLPFKLVIR